MSRAGIVSDPFRFASEERERSGVLGLKDRVRLADVLFGDQGEVEYSLVGEIGQDAKPYFRLKVNGTLGVQCQRCLDRMEWPLDLESLFQLVPPGTAIPDEELEIEDFDAIEATPDFDVFALIEDEVLLAVPIAPRHERCDPPRPEGGTEKESPFAALATLRKISGA
ncbi:YceD family protein [Rhodocyclaceae bacterium SMB388]